MRLLIKGYHNKSKNTNLLTAGRLFFAYEEMIAIDNNFYFPNIHKCIIHYQSAGFLMSSAVTFNSLASSKIPGGYANNLIFFSSEHLLSSMVESAIFEGNELSVDNDQPNAELITLGGDVEDLSDSDSDLDSDSVGEDSNDSSQLPFYFCNGLLGYDSACASNDNVVSNGLINNSQHVEDAHYQSITGFYDSTISDFVTEDSISFIKSDIQILRWFILGCDGMDSLEIGALIRYRRASKRLRKNTRGKSRVLSSLELVPYYRY
jgi:hypothetical protein